MVSLQFCNQDEEEEAAAKPKEKKDSRVGAVATQNITKTKLRAERSTVADEGAEQRRREHQKELAQKKQEEGLKRYAEAGSNQNGAQAKVFKRFESYRRDTQFPSRVRDLKVIVDERNSTVILPIMGRPVPFHINTIKNASKSEEGNTSFLRINFLSPGQGVGKKDDYPFEDITAQFVRSLTFKSDDADHMQDVSTRITELRRNALKREQEKKEMEDVVEQDKLSEIRSRSDPLNYLGYTNTRKIDVHRGSATSTFDRQWTANVFLASLKSMPTVFGISHHFEPINELIFYLAMSNICSSNLVLTN